MFVIKKDIFELDACPRKWVRICKQIPFRQETIHIRYNVYIILAKIVSYFPVK